MIGEAEVRSYRESGFLVVRDVLRPPEVAELRRVTDELVEASRRVRDHDEVYDLEPTHSAREPRVRRIKAPHLRHAAYDRAARHPGVLAILRRLVHPSLRFDTSKLNLKAAGHGAAVEWHQDWAFYPHTNDDLAAVGVMMDDCGPENGPLLCVPGSHKGPVHDHHAPDGTFCGAIDPASIGPDLARAVACTGPAGSISVHHARTIHGSAVNTSTRPRRLLLFQYRAADAWPLLGAAQPGWDAWSKLMLCGDDDPIAPRCTSVPVRLPLPPATHQGSIYENQRALRNSYFGTAGPPAAAPSG